MVAKFRWIGTKLGIIDSDDERNIQTDETSNANNTIRSTTSSSSVNKLSSTMNTSRTILDNEKNEFLLQPNSSAKRKTSPRNNIARVYPTGTNESTGVTLYRRTVTTKFN